MAFIAMLAVTAMVCTPAAKLQPTVVSPRNELVPVAPGQPGRRVIGLGYEPIGEPRTLETLRLTKDPIPVILRIDPNGRVATVATVPSRWRVVPLWLTTILLGAAAAWLWGRRRRRQPGCCRTCGYDLTGNVSGVCPECGTAADVPHDHARP